MYSDDQNAWVVQKVVNKHNVPYVTPQQMIDLTESVVAASIRTNRVETIPDLAATPRVRFWREEPSAAAGSFACIR